MGRLWARPAGFSVLCALAILWLVAGLHSEHARAALPCLSLRSELRAGA
jgi:hypothetical protein